MKLAHTRIVVLGSHPLDQLRMPDQQAMSGLIIDASSDAVSFLAGGPIIPRG
jgi:hypothetical protein